MMEALGVIELAGVLLLLRGGYLFVREGFRHDYRPERWDKAAERRGLLELGVGLAAIIFAQGALELLK